MTEKKSEIDKFKEGARQPKVCPECGHEFRGNGWDGIDSHWKSKHDSVMPYADAWPLIQADKYRI